MSCWQWGKAVRQLQLQGSHSGIITAPIDQGGLTESAGALKYCQGVKVKPMDKVVSKFTHRL